MFLTWLTWDFFFLLLHLPYFLDNMREVLKKILTILSEIDSFIIMGASKCKWAEYSYSSSILNVLYLFFCNPAYYHVIPSLYHCGKLKNAMWIHSIDFNHQPLFFYYDDILLGPAKETSCVSFLIPFEPDMPWVCWIVGNPSPGCTVAVGGNICGVRREPEGWNLEVQCTICFTPLHEPGSPRSS